MVRRMAAHVLETGLGGASLRPLAQAARTSDRMLIYHFGDKDRLIAAVLHQIAADFGAVITGALSSQPGPVSAPDFLQAAWALAGRPDLQPALRLWLELIATAGTRAGGHAAFAQAIIAGFVDQVAGQLADPADAPMIVALFEGLLVLREAGAADAAEAALARFCAR
jgi:AcrR family transcriptional regulator